MKGAAIMEINLNSILLVISLAFMFSYQYSIFMYASNLLIGGSKNKALFVLLAAINTVLFCVYQLLHAPYYLIIITFFLALNIEFKLTSRANYIQIFCGTSIFVLHISAFITPIIAIFSNAVGVTPEELLRGTNYDYLIVIIACSFLIIAQEVVKKHIDNKSIQRVSTQGKYSVMLLVSVMLVVMFQIAHAFLLINDSLYIEQIVLTGAVSLGSLLVFYLFFLYAIGLINANLYKRYSDKVISEQKDISEKKETLTRKSERDDLTGVYNRRYVMQVLENLCASQDSEPFYVLFMDINGLKYTNDTLGHSAGDRLITNIATAIMCAIREDDVLARIGGDEFLVVASNILEQNCDTVIERIYDAIAERDKTEEFLVSASIGSVLVDDGMKKMGTSHILSVADENMRINKERFYKEREGV